MGSNFVSKKMCRSKKVWVKQNLVQKYFDQKKSRPPKIVSKKFCQNWVSNSWNIHDMGKFCQDQCFLDKCDHDSWNRGSQELPLKFSQNWVSSSWDITYMDKCRQDKCWLDKCYFNSWNLFKIVTRIYLSSFVKIGSVTAYIFLIWTNVAKTNVSWTNVILTAGIC